jgi:hypothetical protein
VCHPCSRRARLIAASLALRCVAVANSVMHMQGEIQPVNDSARTSAAPSEVSPAGPTICDSAASESSRADSAAAKSVKSAAEPAKRKGGLLSGLRGRRKAAAQ